ncbi:MAG: flagellar biosynthetic protein FliQ [Stellaceae bacterium]
MPIISAVHQMLVIALTLVTPFLAAAVLTSFAVGLIQATTRINDLTLSFIPRFAAVLLAIYLSAPWAAKMLTGYIERSVVAMRATLG